MPTFSNPQQPIHVRQNSMRDPGPKCWPGSRVCAGRVAAFVMLACICAAEDAGAQPPGDRHDDRSNESPLLSSTEIDGAKVAQVKQAIFDGKFQVNADALTQTLLSALEDPSKSR